MAARFWVGGTGTWDGATTTNWSASSGGAGGASAPLVTDDVTFDTNSLTVNGQFVTVNAGAVCNNLTIVGASVANLIWTFNTNFTASGSCAIRGSIESQRLLWQSGTVGTQKTITLTTVTQLQDIDFMDIKGAGGLASFTGTRIGDALGNATINFTVAAGTSNGGTGVNRYWVGTAGANWSLNTSWSTTSGGASGASLPLAQDDVFFDANSITSASRTITINVVRLGRHINFSAVTNSPILSIAANLVYYGNWTNGTFASISGTPTALGRARTSVTFTSAGFTWPCPWQFVMPGGTITFQDDFTSSAPTSLNWALSFSGGSYNCGNHNFTVPSFNGSFGVLSGTIDYGSSTWVINGANGTAATIVLLMGTAPTIVPGTATISFTDTSSTTKSIQGNSKIFNAISVTGGGTGAILFTTSITITTFTIGPPKALTLTSGITVTVGNLKWHGSAGNLITVTALTPGSAATISKPSGGVVCDWLSLKDSTASGGATFWAGANSTSVSGNSGWIFTAPAVTQTAALSFTGVNHRQTSRLLTAAHSFTGKALKQLQRAPFTASMGPSGIITKRPGHRITAALSFTGKVPKMFLRGFIASLAPNGNFQRAITRILSANLSFSGGLFKQRFLTFIAALGFTGAATKQARTLKLGALSFGGGMQRITRSHPKAVLSFAGSANRRTNRILRGAVSFGGSVRRLTQTRRNAVLSFSGRASKRTSRLLRANASFQGGITKAPRHLLRGSLSFATKQTRRISHRLVASLSPAGRVTRQTKRRLVGGLSFAGTVRHTALKSLRASLTPVGARTRLVRHKMTAQLTPHGLTKRGVVKKPFTAALTMGGTFRRQAQKRLRATLPFVGTWSNTRLPNKHYTIKLHSALDFAGDNERSDKLTFPIENHWLVIYPDGALVSLTDEAFKLDDHNTQPLKLEPPHDPMRTK